MAKIVAYREIPLDSLTIGKGQAGTHTESRIKELDELAESIKVQGLLQPIVVCEAREAGKWEILAGQRRFLAHRHLKRETISAAVLDGRIDPTDAKAISVTENLVRLQLSGKELTDSIRVLYNRYASVRAVAEATGIPQAKIRRYLKSDRLIPELKRMVDDNEIDINAALDAQDAADDDGQPDPDVAVKLAWEMKPMTNVQRRKLADKRRENPEKPIDDVIEEAKTGVKVIQVVATVTQTTHSAIRRYAREEKTNQDEAVVALIEEALTGHGLLEQ